MNWWPLVGVAVVVIGFMLRLRVPLVVVVAAMAAGLCAGMPVVGGRESPGVLDALGSAFVQNRYITLFVLALPAIGLCERYGLQEQARRLIRRVRAARLGRLLMVYHLFRVGVVAMGIRLGSGHAAFVRPLVAPMALETAGLDERAELEQQDHVKAAACGAENYANFYGQNLFPGAAGVMLVVSNFSSAGIDVAATRISWFATAIATSSILVAGTQYYSLSRRARRKDQSGAR